jgi:Zn-dependent protease
MGRSFPGSIRLFTLAGIDVFLHWSWFVVAILEVQFRKFNYQNNVFNALEYLALFLIVLVHEFGHALACRSVGGRADRILLWPLGGVAFVAPPPRPGALLWSIAAGPLVNVVLVPVTIGTLIVASQLGWAQAFPDGWQLLCTVAYLNAGLLIFNLMPVYPLDGGQMLHAILWFFIGRANSLLTVSLIGMAGAVGLAALAVMLQSLWFAVLAAFIAVRAFAGLRMARVLAQALAGPRHSGFACPGCRTPPLAGNYWGCDQCGSRFDTFACSGTCPKCGRTFPEAGCPECHRRYPFPMWYRDDDPYAAGRRGVPREIDHSPEERQGW